MSKWKDLLYIKFMKRVININIKIIFVIYRVFILDFWKLLLVFDYMLILLVIMKCLIEYDFEVR